MGKKNKISIMFARIYGLPGVYDQLDQKREQTGVLRTAKKYIIVAQFVCGHAGSIIGNKSDGGNLHVEKPAHDCLRYC